MCHKSDYDGYCNHQVLELGGMSAYNDLAI